MNSQYNSRFATDNYFLYNSNISSEGNLINNSKISHKRNIKKKMLFPTQNSSTIFSQQSPFDTIGNELNCSIDMINKQLSNMLINR